MRLTAVVLAFLTSVLSASISLAASFYVAPISAPGLAEDDAKTVTELLRNGVTEAGSHTLAKDQASADFVLQSKVLRLGSAYVLTVSKLRGGNQIFQQQARAKTIEDMDTVSNRVVRAVINEVKFETDTRVTDVTVDQETRGTRRRDVVRQWYFGLGPSWGSNLNTDKNGFGWTFGYSWGIDHRFALRLGFDGASFDANGSFTNLALGVDYFFTENDMSPVILAEFGHGSATMKDQSRWFGGTTASGFTLAAGAGMRFFRTSRVNLGVNAKYIHYMTSNPRGNPGGTLVGVGIYF